MCIKTMFGRRSGKTQALIKMQEAMGIDYHFDINDMEHYNEIREQVLAETGKICKINWCVGFNFFLECKRRIEKDKK